MLEQDIRQCSPIAGKLVIAHAGAKPALHERGVSVSPELRCIR